MEECLNSNVNKRELDYPVTQLRGVRGNERPDLNHFRLDNMNKVSEEYIYFLGLESAFLYLFHTFRRI